MGLDYQSLAEAGTKQVQIDGRPVIDYPEGETVEWYGYKRHNFVLDGHEGFIVEPRNPVQGFPWSWCLQWAESFVPRTPALKLLERGFHHVHFNVFSTYMNEEGMKLLEKFYAMLQAMHFHKKAALIGMSYGGLFSLRWAAAHPEAVGAIYLDAPVCSLDFGKQHDYSNPDYDWARDEQEKVCRAYGVSASEIGCHPLSPLNNYLPIAKAKLPIIAIRSGQDQSVFPRQNIDILAAKMAEAGDEIRIIRQDYNGHHPHGLDDPQPLVDFILQHYPEF